MRGTTPAAGATDRWGHDPGGVPRRVDLLPRCALRHGPDDARGVVDRGGRYRLTPMGERAVRARTRQWRSFARAVEQVTPRPRIDLIAAHSVVKIVAISRR